MGAPEVIVAGGGPAGSTLANLLSRAGHSVLLIEKTRFPRFHVGESLLPTEARLYDRLGFAPAPDAYVQKLGADFIDERGIDERANDGRSSDDRSIAEATYPFADGLPGTPARAWQADRAAFDAALLRLAVDAGVNVHEQEKVLELSVEQDGVRVRSDHDTYRARYFVDATGQDAFVARSRRAVEPIRGFGIAAVLCHWSGLSQAASAELEQTGHVRILIFDEGWGWMIPLRGRRLSYGVVTREQGITAARLDEAASCSPFTRRFTDGAVHTEPRIIRNFAYANRDAHGSRYACIGDSAAFLDPVFSSGVTLAMQAAEKLADRLGVALADGTEADAELAAPVAAHMRHAYECFGSLIHAFYNTNLTRHFFFHEAPDPDMRAGLITMLAGDVWRDDNQFQDSLLRSRRRFHMPG